MSLEEIYEVTKDVVNFTKAIHLNGEKLESIFRGQHLLTQVTGYT